MAQLWVKFDTATGKHVATSVAPGGFVVEEFDVGAGGVTEVQLVTDVWAGQTIDVMINGVEKRLGASHDWTLDDGNNKILFNYSIPQNAWIKVKIYP